MATLGSQTASPEAYAWAYRSDYAGCCKAGGLGTAAVLDALLPVVYKELERLAHFQLRQEGCAQSAGGGAVFLWRLKS